MSPTLDLNNQNKNDANKYTKSQDSPFEFHISNSYAKSYDRWREKEEMSKLQGKYGNVSLKDLSSSESEGSEWNSDKEKDFQKTLQLIKSNDAKIYERSAHFFDESNKKKRRKVRKKKDKVMTLKDYERHIIVEKGGQFTDDEDCDEINNAAVVNELPHESNNFSLSAGCDDVRKQEVIKEFNKTVVLPSDSDDEFFTIVSKNDDEDIDENIKGIIHQDFANEQSAPTLGCVDDEEESELENGLSSSVELVEKGREVLSAANKFRLEHRFQESNFNNNNNGLDLLSKNKEYIRQKSTKRSEKRKALKERKGEQRKQMESEINRLKKLKYKEAVEKVATLVSISGTKRLKELICPEDLDEDFDSEKHENMMQKLFDNEYYESVPLDSKKPKLDSNTKYCEDLKKVDFSEKNTACSSNELQQNLVGALLKKRPIFDPEIGQFEKFFDEYYNLHCEDYVCGMPTRFKYRETMENNFGLDVQEILMAEDKELNKWASLKKVVQYRHDYEDKFDKKAYLEKAKNHNKKLKDIPSLSKDPNDQDNFNPGQKKYKKHKKPGYKYNKSRKKDDDILKEPHLKKTHFVLDSSKEKYAKSNDEGLEIKDKKKDVNRELESLPSDSRLKIYGINPKKLKNKIKYSKEGKSEICE